MDDGRWTMDDGDNEVERESEDREVEGGDRVWNDEKEMEKVMNKEKEKRGERRM